MKRNIFDAKIHAAYLERVNQLTPDTQALWGKMNVAQTLAHCNKIYEITYDEDKMRPGFIKRWLLKTFLKGIVVGEKPYKKNSRTAPEFIISDERDFEQEKKNLIDHIQKTYDLGSTFFHEKENISFGIMTSDEWSTLFGKHLDHHLQQFGV